jgi:CRP-like cAMP-binding protein
LETLAREARRRQVPAGTVLVREGEAGDEYFAMLSGRVRVSAGGHVVNELARGEGFGEIALLYDSPRSATVEAVEDTTVLVVERPAFLLAVTGHGPTRDGAAAIARGWAGGAVSPEA